MASGQTALSGMPTERCSDADAKTARAGRSAGGGSGKEERWISGRMCGARPVNRGALDALLEEKAFPGACFAMAEFQRRLTTMQDGAANTSTPNVVTPAYYLEL